MIGIFDSGSGGLSVAHALHTLSPQTDITYFGDTKHMPYGSKSQSELKELTINALQFLKEQGCSHIISACNSISAQVIIPYFSDIKETLIEMVEPTTEILRKYAGQSIAIVATPATVQSGMYAAALAPYAIRPMMIASVELAGAIEHDDQALIRQEIEKIITVCRMKECSVLSLSCTHYPLVKDYFEEEIKNQQANVILIDPSYAVALKATQHFPMEGTGIVTGYISEASSSFTQRFSRLFPNGILHTTTQFHCFDNT